MHERKKERKSEPLPCSVVLNVISCLASARGRSMECTTDGTLPLTCCVAYEPYVLLCATVHCCALLCIIACCCAPLCIVVRCCAFLCTWVSTVVSVAIVVRHCAFAMRHCCVLLCVTACNCAALLLCIVACHLLCHATAICASGIK